MKKEAIKVFKDSFSCHCEAPKATWQSHYNKEEIQKLFGVAERWQDCFNR